MTVQTNGSGRPFPAFPWAYIIVTLAMLGSIILGGVVRLETIDTELWVNASTNINGSLYVRDNLNVTNNVTADYFIGNGSQLTDISVVESDPFYNRSWNESYADTLYADISVTGDNSSWSESRADTLYADIIWGYNMTQAAYDLWNTIWSYTNTTAELVSVINAYPTGNTTAEINSAESDPFYNRSWNETRADNIYLNTIGDTVTGSGRLNFRDANTYIYSSTNDVLDISARAQLNLQHDGDIILNLTSTGVDIVGDISASGEGAKLCKVLIDTYEGNGSNNREIDLGDDYDEIHIQIEESYTGNDNHFSGAYAIKTTYGTYLTDTGTYRVSHQSMASANAYFQGKMTGVDSNKIKLASAVTVQGTNVNGKTYRIIAKKYCGVETLP